MIMIGATVALLGLITFWLPLPVGLPLLLLGIVILMRYSATIRSGLAIANRRFPAFRRLFRRVLILRRRISRWRGRLRPGDLPTKSDPD